MLWQKLQATNTRTCAQRATATSGEGIGLLNILPPPPPYPVPLPFKAAHSSTLASARGALCAIGGFRGHLGQASGMRQ